MARQAEKQLAKDNTAKIALLRRGAISVNLIFVLVRFIYCRASTTKKTYFLYLLTNAIACTIQLQLEKLGSPTFNSDGSLRSAGGDLGQAGVTEYLTDIVYMTWIVYLLVALITDYAWLLYLAVCTISINKKRLTCRFLATRCTRSGRLSNLACSRHDSSLSSSDGRRQEGMQIMVLLNKKRALASGERSLRRSRRSIRLSSVDSPSYSCTIANAFHIFR
jgi:hypothetical protein